MYRSDVERYEFIDSLRGIAILGVILVHSSQSVAPSSETLLWFMNEGARGVQLFFVASALTLCMSWNFRSVDKKYQIRNFYIRRFFRIAPMFYVAILGYSFINGFGSTYWAPNGIDWWFIPITAIFLHGFHPETITSVVPGGWSIAVEMSFYLVFPFLILHIKSLKACCLFLAGSLMLSGINFLMMPYIFSYPESQQYLVKNFSFLNFLGQFPVFVMGILGYLIFCKKYNDKKIAIGGGLLFCIFLLMFLYPVFKLVNVFIVNKLLNAFHHFIAGGLFCAFAILLARWPVKFLVNKVMAMIGVLSFSMYLTHFAILTLFFKLGISDIFPKSDLGSLCHFLCVVLATVTASFFLYTSIERPGIALGKWVIEKLGPNATLNTDPANVDGAR